MSETLRKVRPSSQANLAIIELQALVRQLESRLAALEAKPASEPTKAASKK